MGTAKIRRKPAMVAELLIDVEVAERFGAVLVGWAAVSPHRLGRRSRGRALGGGRGRRWRRALLTRRWRSLEHGLQVGAVVAHRPNRTRPPTARRGRPPGGFARRPQEADRGNLRAFAATSADVLEQQRRRVLPTLPSLRHGLLAADRAASTQCLQHVFSERIALRRGCRVRRA